jgi:hypothetical protein
MRPVKSFLSIAVAVLLVLGTSTFEPTAWASDPDWTQTKPTRVLDTRPNAVRAPGSITKLQLAGKGNIPGNAKTVVLNVAVVTPQRAGYLTVFPCDQPRPTTSNVNYTAGLTQANLVVATLDGTGSTCIYTLARTHMVVDIQGYSSDSFGLPQPSRVLDTRPQGARGAGSVTELKLGGSKNIPSSATTAILNLTVVDPQAEGYITVYPCDTARPDTSNVNYAAGNTQANLVFASLDGGGKTCIYTLAPTNIVVDVQGYTTDAFGMREPARLLDTRVDAMRAGGSVTEVQLAASGSIPANANTAMLNVSVVDPQAGGFLTVYPCDSPRPETSNVNYGAGETHANLVFASLGGGGSTCIYTLAPTHLVVDIQGWMTAKISTTPIDVTQIWQPEAGAGFVHPGVFVDGVQLDEVKANVAAGRQPWVDAFNRVRSWGSSHSTAARGTTYKYSSLSYVPSPVSVIQAADSGQQAYLDANGFKNIGGVEHLDDAQAAYTDALLWYLTGDQAYADKSIEIMNAWSRTLKEIKFDSPVRSDNGSPVYGQGKLQAGWGASLFARAAEIVRYTGAGWSNADIARFETMLQDVYLPLTISGWSNGANWMMTFAEATISIGVFTNDRATFDAGVAMWRSKAPTTIYMPGDGSWPIPPASNFNTADRMRSLWYNPTKYIAGLQTETLRDLTHMTMGLAAMANAAETAYIQGIDLYAEQANRIVTGFEVNAGFVNAYLDEVDRLGGAAPSASWIPPGWPGAAGTFRLNGDGYKTGWLVAYHHFTTRTGTPMPQTARLVKRLGAPANQAALHRTWEPLTHWS